MKHETNSYFAYCIGLVCAFGALAAFAVAIFNKNHSAYFAKSIFFLIVSVVSFISSNKLAEKEDED